MFHRATDASKVALVHLVGRLRRGGYRLLDAQFVTNHLATFGAVEIDRSTYRSLLAQALASGVEQRTWRPPVRRRGPRRNRLTRSVVARRVDEDARFAPPTPRLLVWGKKLWLGAGRGGGTTGPVFSG